MSEQKPKKKGRWERLRHRYRMVIMEDDTLELRSSVKLSLFNVYLALSVLLVVMTVFIVSLIYFSPIKNYLVGYDQVRMTRTVLEQERAIDSLVRVANAHDAWLDNLQRKLRGEADTSFRAEPRSGRDYNRIDLGRVPPEDLALREEISQADVFSLRADDPQQSGDWRSAPFMLPLDGLITAGFDPTQEHYGIDIVAKENSPVRAVRDGTVVDRYWDAETGNVVVLQHGDNLLSLYKHNRSVLAKVGSFVRAGDAIAIVGNTGELSSGPHLHFELWHDRAPLDPEDFLTFN
jgi:murein DD-endopeptidase MepM/ murein hydrolase activator NlpD